LLYWESGESVRFEIAEKGVCRLLPVVTEETRKSLEQSLLDDEESWKKKMVHRLKEENPEINSLLLDLAQRSKDPKAVILAGYIIYNALELALEEEET
jgi:hypothetical protein